MPDQLQPIVQRMIDAGESEENIATVIQHFKSQAPPPVARGGLVHPLTSMIAPELEAVRGHIKSALATPHGTPIMARSRTGALYQSETGTGAVNAMKGAAQGAAEGLIDEAEGITSPLGAGLGIVGAVGPKTIGRGAIRTIASAGDVVDPDVIGVFSPRGAKVVNIAQRARAAMDKTEAGASSVPRSLDSTARVLEPAEAPAAAPAPAPAALSTAERAQLVKQGYSPELIDKIASQAGGPQGGVIRTMGRVEPMPSHEPTMPSELQQPRVDVGAQKVGRANGLTKEQVRQQTAPIVGEAQGEASPILPEKALQNIIDKMRSLPKGGPEREAYVQAATSGKTRGQVENIRRTLEHLGLIVPVAAAAPSVRDMLLQRMRAGVTGPRADQ